MNMNVELRELIEESNKNLISIGVFDGEKLVEKYNFAINVKDSKYEVNLKVLEENKNIYIENACAYFIENYNPSDLFIATKCYKNILPNFTRVTNGQLYSSNKTYYTYKITASDSSKYYYGVSHVKKSEATVDDCLNDGYFGTGGFHYNNWKAKHLSNITKEIIGLFNSKIEAYDNEKFLIGDLYKTDENCLNVTPGGLLVHGPRNIKKNITEEYCEFHGEVTKHQAGVCCKCLVKNVFTMQECPIHGLVKFRGGNCVTCLLKEKISLKNCIIHGEVKHKDNNCVTCQNLKNINIKECSIHGAVKHIGDKCQTCINNKSVSEKICPVHGLNKFQGEKCSSCNNSKLITLKNCPIHGESKHRGDTCYKCSNSRTVKMKKCEIHGLVKHQGDKCCSCNSQFTKIEELECQIHGLVKFQAGICTTCKTDKEITLKNCAIHGEVKHRGSVCLTCNSKNLISNRECPVHGLTKHSGASCCKCSKAKILKK